MSVVVDINEARLWLAEEFRPNIIDEGRNAKNLYVQAHVEVMKGVVKKLASRFNHEGMSRGCTPKPHPLTPGSLPSSTEFIEPFAKLLQRFDFKCAEMDVVVPEKMKEDVQIELCRQFYKCIKNLEINPAADPVTQSCATGYLKYVPGVLLHGDEAFALGKQVYNKGSLKCAMSSAALNADVYLKEDGRLAEEPYFLDPISFDT
jgi:hypothetical protein